MATLTLSRGGKVLWTRPLEGHLNRIGRDPHMDIVLADAEVSRRHAVIYQVDGAHRLIDNSTNGTLVNGAVRRVARLGDGDRVDIGPYALGYKAEGDDAPLPATAPTGGPGTVVGYSASSGRFLTSQDILVVRDQESAPLAWTLGGRARIGAGTDADLVVDSAPAPCEVVREGRRYRLRSDRPVLVDGAASTEAVLKPGSTVHLGRATLELTTEEGQEDIGALPQAEYEGMVGASPPMARLYAMIERIAPLSDSVIVLGETGTGKELVARALHRRSGRKGELVAVNCGAISRELAESELFGHARGAFTGAHGDREGAFERAHGGTLFLDELGELPTDLQVKLLRVLETSTLSRVGETRARSVDVRIVCATHRDLSQEVQAGRFRQDLFFRLFVIPLQLAPLRERAGDLPLLVESFLAELAPERALSADAMARLSTHTWPGNVRELRHVLRRTLACTPGRVITAEDLQILPQPAAATDRPLPPLSSLEEMERLLIERTVQRLPNRRDAAQALGIARSTLQQKLKKYGLG